MGDLLGSYSRYAQVKSKCVCWSMEPVYDVHEYSPVIREAGVLQIEPNYCTFLYIPPNIYSRFQFLSVYHLMILRRYVSNCVLLFQTFWTMF